MANFQPLSQIPFQLTNPDTGAPASGFTLEAFLAGTTTPTPLYSDAGGTSLGTSVSTNSAGYFVNGSGAVTNVYISTVLSYKFILRDEDSGTEWTIDGVPALSTVLNVTTPSYDTFDDLRAVENGSGTVQVAGAIAAGDGGHGVFVFDAGDTSSADNGGTIIVDSTSPRTGAWKRLITGARTNAAWFGISQGAWNQTRVDAATAWAIDNGNWLYFPQGSYVGVNLDMAMTNFIPVKISGDGKIKTFLINLDSTNDDDEAAINIEMIGNTVAPETGTGNTTGRYNADVVVEDLSYMSNSSTLGRHFIGARAGDVSNQATIEFNNVSFLRCRSTFRPLPNGDMERYIYNNVEFHDVGQLIGYPTNFSVYSNHTIDIKNCKISGVYSAGGFIPMIDSSRGPLNINIDGFKLDNSSTSGGALVAAGVNFTSSFDFNILLRNIQRFQPTASEAPFTLVTVGNNTDQRGSITIDSCGSTLDATDGDGGFTMNVENLNLLKINNTKMRSITAVNVGHTTVLSSYVTEWAFDAASLDGLSVISTQHPGVDGGAADANYFGPTFDLGDVSTASLSVGGGDSLTAIQNITGIYAGRANIDGTAVSLPAGWTANDTGGAGIGGVNHNLGTTNYSVVVSPAQNGRSVAGVLISSNGFSVSMEDSAGSAAIASEYSFILTPNA